MTRSSRFVSGVAAVALAPFLPLSPPASAQSADPASRPYRLDSRATFQKGCFAPCMCPVMMQGPLRGTFRLTPTGTSGDYSTWDVTDVNWKAFVTGGSELRITGSGTYRRGSGTMVKHELSLDLVVGDLSVDHYDSGLVPVETALPRIDIEISLHGRYCFDTVMEVHAKPLLRLTVDASRLTWDSTQGATGYDIVRGDLAAVRARGGEFGAATAACLGNDWTASAVDFGMAPQPGNALWLLVREVDGSVADTWDEGDAYQITSRDPGINSSPSACP